MSSSPPSDQVLNGIGHFDIAGPSLAVLAPFYEAVLGWSVQPRGPGYAQLQTPPGSANGALVEAQSPSITLGVVVPDLAAALEQAQRQQGGVTMPITDNGWVRKAQVHDPAGNVITLIEAGPHR
ncbi:MAG: VOC family protein [Burkholderiaceae bacterium]|nr:VOC family protein [Burkholderiaceae bacterium]